MIGRGSLILSTSKNFRIETDRELNDLGLGKLEETKNETSSRSSCDFERVVKLLTNNSQMFGILLVNIQRENSHCADA